MFLYRNDFQKALNSYFTLTGYPPLPPRNALGVWWNKNEDYNSKDIESLLNNFKKEEIPLSILLLGNKWNKTSSTNLTPAYNFNKEKFPNIINLANEIHKSNISLGVTINTIENLNSLDVGYNTLKQTLNIKTEEIPINVYNTNILNTFYTETLETLQKKA